MRIIVDADATPSINLITDIAYNYSILLILYVDTSHNIKNDYAIIKVCSKGFQSVDMAIINDIIKDDILITQDFGLATLALSRNSKVINPKGMIYNNDNIDRLNFERHLNGLNRKAHIHMKGPKKRNGNDEVRLEESIIKCINDIRGNYEEGKYKEE